MWPSIGIAGPSVAILVWLALALPTVSRAAPFEVVEGGWSVRGFAVEDGLPIGSITGIAQSPDGYLWLSTLDGLVRFDGVRFRVYRSGDRQEMPSDRLTTLRIDDVGAVWFTTLQQQLLRLRRGAIEPLDRSAGLPDERVLSWREGVGRELWLGTRAGAALCRSGRCEPVPESLGAQVLAIAPASEFLWIGTFEQGLLGVGPDGAITRLGVGQGLPSAEVQALSLAENGDLWIGTAAGLVRLPSGRVHAEPAEGEVARERILRLERSGRDLYVGTATGLFVVRDGRVLRLSRHGTFTGAERLVLETPLGRMVNLGDRLEIGGRVLVRSDRPITTVFLDREQNLWVGTDGAGVARLRRSPITAVGTPEGLPSDNVYPIVEGPSGGIWLGTLGAGLVRLRGDRIEAWGAEDGLPHHTVWSIVVDGPESAWVGTNGLRRFSSGRFTTDGVDRRLLDVEVRALLAGRGGELWVGTYELGLFRRAGSGEWRRWGDAEGLATAPIRVLAEAPDGAIWLGTNGAGIARCRPEGSCQRLTQAEGLPSDLVRALWIDEENDAIWVGTENRGLARVASLNGDLEAARPVVVRSADGLYDDGIHQIVDDGLGRLWMNTNRGLFWVEQARLEAFVAGEVESVRSVVYTEEDGLRDREGNGGVQSAGLRASDGRLWFPTQGGAVVVDPGSLAPNPPPPMAIVEQVEARSPNGTRVLVPASESETPRLDLALGERNLQVDYTAPTFVGSERIRFRYRLEGLDPSWTEAGESRQLTLSYLPPGSYRLELVAANADGVWSSDGATLDLVVPARFWETPAFSGSLIATAFLGLLGAGLWRRRLAALRERELERTVAAQTAELAQEKGRVEKALERVEVQAEQLRELDRAKSHFFANVSHELRTPLTLLLGPLVDAEREQGGVPGELVPPMRRNAQRLQRMIEQILDLQKLEAGTLSLDVEGVDLRRLVRRAVQAFAPLAERRGVELRADLPEEALEVRVDVEQIERVLGNLLSNALRYTNPGGRILVEGTRGADRVQVAVRDTGRGIPPEALPRLFERFFQVDASSARAAEGMGIGLALARELMTLHDGSIEAESELGVGSTFRLTLPLDDGSSLVASSSESRESGTEGSTRDTTAPAPRSPDAPADEPDDEQGGRPTVLVVDDSDDVRDYLRRTLSARFAVIDAAEGAAALQLARAELPDLIVADVMMPGMDGFELGRALRDDPMTGGIPLVYLTARAGDEDALEGFASSAVAYLTKPFDSSALLARVGALLAQQRRLRVRLRAELHADSEEAAEDPARGPFERRLREIASARLHEEGFGVEQLAAEVHLARNTVYRKLKDEGGPSPADLLRAMRLERARGLLESGEGNVSEVAYAVGFDTLAGFGKAYRRHFGVAPSEHLRRGPT